MKENYHNKEKNNIPLIFEKLLMKECCPITKKIIVRNIIKEYYPSIIDWKNVILKLSY